MIDDAKIDRVNTIALIKNLAVKIFKYDVGLTLFKYELAPSSLYILAIIAFDDNAINNTNNMLKAIAIIVPVNLVDIEE